jgi:hypothetical protein
MRTRKIILLLCVMTAVSLSSCRKDAGVSGKKISGTVFYKNGVTGNYEYAPSAQVNIAYGTTQPTNYFNQTVLSDVNGTYRIEGLNKGDYFISAWFTDANGFQYTTPGYTVSVRNKKDEITLDIMLQ